MIKKINLKFIILIIILLHFFIFINIKFISHYENNSLIMKELRENNNESLAFKNKSTKNLNIIEKMEKMKLLEFLSKSLNKNISKVKSIYLGHNSRFGNQLIIFKGN